MPSAQVATGVSCSFNMMEDYLQTMLPPLAPSVANCFTVVQNDREQLLISELITVSNQNNLLRFYPDSASNSGWNQEEVLVDGAPDSNIQKIVSFYQAGTLYALAHYDAGNGSEAVIGMQRTVATDWGLMPFDPDLQNALGQMTQTDAFRDSAGVQYFYGVSQGFQPAAFVLVGQDPQSGTWEPVYMEPQASPTATYRILPGYGGNQMTVVTVDGPNATFRGGSVVNGQLQWDGKAPVTHDLGQGPITAEQVFAVPSASGDQGFLLQGANDQLLHVSGYDSAEITVLALTGGAAQPPGVLTVSVGQAQQNLYMVFAIDNVDQRLWLLRQSASGTGGVVTFDPWVPLGNNLGELSCPAVMGTGPELMFYDLNANVGHMCQQVEQGNWFTQTLASPSPASLTPTHTSTYSTQFVTTDDGGNMVPGSVVQITSDRPTVAVINSISYHIDSKTPATVVSDSSGRVTVAAVAGSLLSPALTVTSETFGVKGPFRSDLGVHQRLAGQDPTFPVNGDSMKAAGLIPASVSSSDADALAAKTQALGQAALTKQTGAAPSEGYRALAGTGFEIDFTRRSGMVRDLSATEAARHATDAVTLSASDIWGDICNFFRHIIDDLEKLIITFAEDVVYVAVKLADGIKHFVLKTLAEIGDCIEIFLQAVASLVKKIVNAIKTAIKWLRALFGWDDILRTKQVVSYYINQTIQNLAYDFTTTIPDELIALFTKAKADVVNVFNNLENIFQAGMNFNGMGPVSSNDPAAKGGPPYMGVGLNTSYQANSVQCNFVHSKMVAASNSIAPRLKAATAGGAGFDPQKIIEIFEQTFPTAQLEQSWEKIKEFSSNIHNAKGFLEAVVLDLMEVIKDMVLLILTGIEAVLVAVSEVMGLALDGLDAILTAKIDIPIISQLYKWIAKADLTMLDLLSLLVALPTTILYKILYGGPNLNPPFTQAQVQEILSNPIPWPSFDPSTGQIAVRGRQAAVASTMPEAAPVDKALALLFMFTMLGYLVMDIGLDIQAAADAGGGGEPALPVLDPTVIGGIVSIVLTIGLQGFGVPYAAMKRINEKQGTSADIWSIVAWCTAWIPPALDTAFAIGSPSKKITRFQSKVGPFLSMAAGIVMISCGAVAVNEMRKDTVNYNVSNQAAMLLPTFPYIFQPIVLLGMDTPPTVAAQVGLWAVDIIGDLGTGVALLLALSPDNTSDQIARGAHANS